MTLGNLRAYSGGNAEGNTPPPQTNSIKIITYLDNWYFVTDTDGTLLCNGIDDYGAVVAILPDAASCEGRILTFKKIGGTSNSPAVAFPQDGQTIDGGAYLVIYDVGKALSIQSDGTNWIYTADYLSEDQCDIQVFISSGNWIKPQFAKEVHIICIGGGGGGGGGAVAPADVMGGGGGGGGGGRSEFVCAANQLPGNLTVTVGAGGAGGLPGENGTNGGDSTISDYCVARGGKGGSAGATTEDSGSEGGEGGLGNIAIGGTGGYGAGPIGLGTCGAGSPAGGGGGGGGGWDADSNPKDGLKGGSGGDVLGGDGGTGTSVGEDGSSSTNQIMNAVTGSGGGGGAPRQRGGDGGRYGGGGGGLGGGYIAGVPNLVNTLRILNSGSGYPNGIWTSTGETSDGVLITIEAPKISGDGPANIYCQVDGGKIVSVWTDSCLGIYDGTEIIEVTDLLGGSGAILKLILINQGGYGASGAIIVATV